MSEQRHIKHVVVVGPMPPFYELAFALWGRDTDFDSDGDSTTPESTSWRELTLMRRPNYDQRVDIDPLDEASNTLVIRSSSEQNIISIVRLLTESGSILAENSTKV